MITVEISAAFQHSSAIFTPREVDPSMKRFYSIALPYGPQFEDCLVTKSGNVIAKSQRAPIIMIGDATMSDELHWHGLIDRTNTWRIPLDTLLIDRPLKVACELWTPNIPPSVPGQRPSDHKAINLVAVQILGDLTKSPLLDERISEIKSWFDR